MCVEGWKGGRYEVCYCVVGKVRGACVPGCVAVILNGSVFNVLLNCIILCGRAWVSEDKFLFNCYEYDCNRQ